LGQHARDLSFLTPVPIAHLARIAIGIASSVHTAVWRHRGSSGDGGESSRPSEGVDRGSIAERIPVVVAAPDDNLLAGPHDLN
jgi:hypothetical protein